MTPPPTPRRIPLLAVLSLHDLRRLLRQARATGKVQLAASPRREARPPRAA